MADGKVDLVVMCYEFSGWKLYSFNCTIGFVKNAQANFVTNSEKEFRNQIYENEGMNRMKGIIREEYRNRSYCLEIRGIQDQIENRRAIEEFLFR